MTCLDAKRRLLWVPHFVVLIAKVARFCLLQLHVSSPISMSHRLYQQSLSVDLSFAAKLMYCIWNICSAYRQHTPYQKQISWSWSALRWLRLDCYESSGISLTVALQPCLDNSTRHQWSSVDHCNHVYLSTYVRWLIVGGNLARARNGANHMVFTRADFLVRILSDRALRSEAYMRASVLSDRQVLFATCCSFLASFAIRRRLGQRTVTLVTACNTELSVICVGFPLKMKHLIWLVLFISRRLCTFFGQKTALVYN